MSGTGEAREDFAGEERAFRIRLGEIRRIEGKCGARIGEVAHRLAKATLAIGAAGGKYVDALALGLDIAADDVREPIYQGLMGGGLTSNEATALVRSAIDDRGLRGIMDNVSIALAVLVATSEVPKDAAGEGKAGSNLEPKAAPSTSPNSTEPASPSV